MSRLKIDKTVKNTLEGKIVAITGASRGLGKAFSTALASYGASVGLIARSEENLRAVASHIRELGGVAIEVPADISNEDSINLAIEKIETNLGHIDILINNAGIAGPTGADWTLDPKEWWEVFEVNVLGQFLVSKAVISKMVQQGKGRVVNVSSAAAGFPSSNYSAYCASKAALTMWTECLAHEAARHGISVLAYHPGTVKTDMTEYSAAQSGENNPIVNHIVQAFEEGTDTPLKRTVEGLIYVASGGADALIGRQIDVDVDLNEWVERSDEINEKDLYTLRINGLESTE